MLAEVTHYLSPHPGSIVVDCTLGGAGHASVIAAAIAPDGLLIVTSGATVRTVAVGVDAWIARACQEVGRTLSPDEWRDVLPDRPYDPACSH